MLIVNTTDYEVGASGVQFPPGVPVEIPTEHAEALIAANPQMFAEATPTRRPKTARKATSRRK